MSEEKLPEPFQGYWKIKGEIPTTSVTNVTQEHFSEQWRNFLKAINDQIKEDLEQK